MATQVQVPPLGESVKQAILVNWHKADGETVKVDEPICELETDKANVDIPATHAGVLRHLKNQGDTVAVGEPIARIEAGAGAPAKAAAPAATGAGAAAATPGAGGAPSTPAPAAEENVALEDYSPAVRRLIEEHRLDPAQITATGPGGRLTKEDVEQYVSRGGNGKSGAAASTPAPANRSAPEAPPAPATPVKSPGRPSEEKPGTSERPGPVTFDANGIHRAPMSKIRQRIAQRLVEAQQTAAILTTFNEVDLTEIISLRSKHKEAFEKIHGVGLGFMSFFVRATCLALKELPRINAFIEGNDIVYHNYVHIGIAVSTDRGLAVPVLRNAEKMGFARIEAEIKRLANATRDGKLGLDELQGGTFSITNGGVFGSLLSTPILNPPQSAILGMHSIQKRPVVIGDKIEVRSMMYTALSYDHRIVDGKEAITFLVRLKQLLEEPARLMLEI